MIAGTKIVGPFHAVVFDCGDTLVQLAPTREAIFQAVAFEMGISVGMAEIQRAYETVEFSLPQRSSQLRSKEARDDFYLAWNTALCCALGIEQSISDLHPRLLERFADQRRWTACPGAAGTLAHLAGQVPLYVLANWNAQLSEVLDRAGLRRWFRSIHASAELGADKPASACFEAFLRLAGITSSTTLYVGNDYVADVVGARKAGFTPILIDGRDRMPAADCVRVRSLDDLVPLLADHLA